MNNKIKLIFGENGNGKSLYYKNKNDDPSYIALNYDIENWYEEIKDNKGKTKNYIISQEKYLNSGRYKRIDSLEENIYKNKKYFGKVNKTSFNNFLKNIEFNNRYKWKEFSEDYKNEDNILDNNIELYISISEHFDKYKKIIDSLSDESFELVKIYMSFKFKKINNLKTKKAEEYQEKLLVIQNSIYEQIKNIENINEILAINNIEILDKIKNNNLKVEKLIELIKSNVISCEEVKEIFKLMDDIEEKKQKCLNFNDYKDKIKEYNEKFNKAYEISDDGYSIKNIDLSHEKYSNGQRIILFFWNIYELFCKF